MATVTKDMSVLPLVLSPNELDAHQMSEVEVK